ncbi:hypothetical protein CDAR_387891 [Caerostris darwini]|uniref:Uncharacterized protein n=1 Tax=Caerostris darwini TaxID=1538125 RepID=A0AAV4SUX6_9ARAC|nr:hypothetical protein CDAR_387891 [Caerostris darwini]
MTFACCSSISFEANTSETSFCGTTSHKIAPEINACDLTRDLVERRLLCKVVAEHALVSLDQFLEHTVSYPVVFLLTHMNSSSSHEDVENMRKPLHRLIQIDLHAQELSSSIFSRANVIVSSFVSLNLPSAC